LIYRTDEGEKEGVVVCTGEEFGVDWGLGDEVEDEAVRHNFGLKILNRRWTRHCVGRLRRLEASAAQMDADVCGYNFNCRVR